MSNENILIVTLLAVTLIIFLFSTLYITDNIISQKLFHTKTLEIIILISLVTNIALLFSLLISKSNPNSNIVFEPRTIIMLISLVVAFMALLVTVNNNKKNAETNLDVHHTNLLIKMIENNYKLIKDEHIETAIKDKILTTLKNKFKSENLIVDYLSNALVSKIPEIDFSNYNTEMSSLPISRKTELNKIQTLNKDSLHRLVLSYLQKNHKSKFNKIDENTRKKTFGIEIYSQLTSSVTAFRDIENFLNSLNINGDILQFTTPEKIISLINETYIENYNELGHFFRHTHRIIKLINQYYPEDLERRKEFLGILRTYYSENVLLAIYYNSTFTLKGYGLGLLLINSDFFGNNKEIKHENFSHFRKSSLVLGQIDQKILLELYTKNSSNLDELTRENYEDHIKKLILNLNQKVDF